MAKKTKINKMNYKPKKVETKFSKSKTIPSESMTVRQMLNKHANGINFDNVKTPFYEDQASLTTTSIHELQKMDLTDKIQYLQEHGEKVKNLQSKIQVYKKEQEELAKQNEKGGTGEAVTSPETPKNDTVK